MSSDPTYTPFNPPSTSPHGLAFGMREQQIANQQSTTAADAADLLRCSASMKRVHFRTAAAADGMRLPSSWGMASNSIVPEGAQPAHLSLSELDSAEQVFGEAQTHIRSGSRLGEAHVQGPGPSLSGSRHFSFGSQAAEMQEADGNLTHSLSPQPESAQPALTHSVIEQQESSLSAQSEVSQPESTQVGLSQAESSHSRVSQRESGSASQLAAIAGTACIAGTAYTAAAPGVVCLILGKTEGSIPVISHSRALTLIAEGARCALTGPYFKYALQHAEPAVLRMVLQSVVVAANMRADQKAQLVKLIGTRGLSLPGRGKLKVTQSCAYQGGRRGVLWGKGLGVHACVHACGVCVCVCLPVRLCVNLPSLR